MHSPHQKPVHNQYKALYQLTKKKRANIANKQIVQHQNDQDSLQKYTINSPSEKQSKIKQTHQIRLSKKSLHNRSNSCPFMNPTDIHVRSIKIIEDQSRRTLKKTSAKHHHLPKNRKQRNFNHENAHQRKNRLQIMHKNSNSQISQESNTVVVHPLPIQQLSSMLYSLSHDKEHINQQQNKNRQNNCNSKFSKKSSIGISNSCLYDKHIKKRHQTPNFTHVNHNNGYMVSLHNDLYFKTKLHHQMKMYDLNQDMRNLQKQTENVKVRQQVLEILAQKFQHIKIDDDGNSQEFQDSLLIHS